MMRFNNHADGEAIANHVGALYNPRYDAVIANVNGAFLLGGVLYQNYTGSSVEMHMAGFAPRWNTKDAMWLFYHYPFEQLGCKLVFAQIPERNEKSIDITARLGFEEVIRIPGVYPDCGLVVMQMQKDKCKWLHINCEARRRMEKATSGKESQRTEAA